MLRNLININITLSCKVTFYVSTIATTIIIMYLPINYLSQSAVSNPVCAFARFAK